MSTAKARQALEAGKITVRQKKIQTSGSVFRIDPVNELGLDFQRTRSRALGIALSKPEDYYDLRQTMVSEIVEYLVENTYDAYYNLLTTGITPAGKALTYGAEDVPFNPNLPTSVVNKFALRSASAIKDIAEEAIDEILPVDYNALAERASKSVLRAKGINL